MPWALRVTVAFRRIVLSVLSFAAPPADSITLASRALPSGLLAAGAEATAARNALPSGLSGGGALVAIILFFNPGLGIVISRVVTAPNALRGLSKSAALPTTSTANLFLSRYFLATRSTSSAVTLATPF